MSHWKVGGALHSPKGILSHSYRPMLPRVKAVYCLDSSSIGTCQNPEFMSNVKKWAAPARLSSVSQMRGNGWESLTVKELSFLKSIQKRSDHPSFLQVQQHYTMGCCSAGSPKHLALTSNVPSPHPTEEAGSYKNAP